MSSDRLLHRNEYKQCNCKCEDRHRWNWAKHFFMTGIKLPKMKCIITEEAFISMKQSIVLGSSIRRQFFPPTIQARERSCTPIEQSEEETSGLIQFGLQE